MATSPVAARSRHHVPARPHVRRHRRPPRDSAPAGPPVRGPLRPHVPAVRQPRPVGPARPRVRHARARHARARRARRAVSVLTPTPSGPLPLRARRPRLLGHRRVRVPVLVRGQVTVRCRVIARRPVIVRVRTVPEASDPVRHVRPCRVPGPARPRAAQGRVVRGRARPAACPVHARKRPGPVASRVPATTRLPRARAWGPSGPARSVPTAARRCRGRRPRAARVVPVPACRRARACLAPTRR